jgi:hypothetical protein
MTRALVIDKSVRAAIDAAVAAAKKDPTPWEVLAPFAVKDPGPELKLSDRNKGNAELAEKLVRRSQFVPIPMGYLAAISFEHQPAGLCRHLSVSVDTAAEGMLPHMVAVGMIAEAFGFRPGAKRRIWIEEFAPGERAVNVVEVEGPS